MAKKKSQTETPMQSMRERKQQELEARLQRVRKARSTYQRKIIGTALVFFIILIILCALLPADESANYDGKWNKDVNSRQSRILQSLQDNFK